MADINATNSNTAAACEREGGLSAIVLAAGQGTRMRSDLPKVCHPVGGRAMVCAVVDACLEVGCERVVVVVGYKQELVRAALAEQAEQAEQAERGRVIFAVQDEQLGTGHAVRCAKGHEAGVGAAEGDVLVLCGDGPLIRAETLATLVERHRSAGAAATLATAVLDDPSGYGRVVRDDAGGFERIVEEKNASERELEIREINPSYYCFDAASLFGALERVGRDERTGEYYLTDVPAVLREAGERVEVIAAVPPEDVLSINTPEQLETVDRVLRARSAAGTGGGG